MEILSEEFSNRLYLPCEEDLQLKLVEDQFSINSEETLPHVNSNIIDLQDSWNLYIEKSIGKRVCKISADVWTRKILKSLYGISAKQMFSLFGSTYIRDHTFSVLILLKAINLLLLTNVRKVSSSNIDPGCDELLTNKWCNVSHKIQLFCKCVSWWFNVHHNDLHSSLCWHL